MGPAKALENVRAGGAARAGSGSGGRGTLRSGPKRCRRAELLAFALALLAACGTRPPPPTPERMVSLSVESVPVGEAVRQLSRAAGLAVVIDPDAEAYAACARVSLSAPAPRPARELVDLLRRALAGSGFTIASGPTGLVLTHDGRTRPAGCAPPVDFAAADGPDPARLDPGPALPAGQAPVADASASVRRISDTEWLATRAARDALLLEPARLMGRTRIVPRAEGGQVVGVRLYGMEPSSILAAIGFQNGDVVSEVNGQSIVTPDGALEAYARSRDADVYRILLERQGQPRTHVIRIVDTMPR